MNDTFTIVNPARFSEVVGQVELQNVADVDRVIESAARAYPDWSRTSVNERVERLKAAAGALTAALAELTTLFVRENGKPLREAERDIRRSIELMDLIAEELPRWWTPELYDAQQPVWARRRSRGVTAVISPWNSPVLLSLKRLIPALATGNTVIVKPATYCPLTVMECIRMMNDHFPAGVIHVVTGSGATVGERLAMDSRIRAIAFTGSTETGRRIMELASRNLKRVFLELGGNDPAIVLHDAELDPSAVARMTNAILRAAGQVCVAIKRIYVHESRYDELVEKLSASFDNIAVGDGLNPAATMGPLNNRPQFELVSGLIDRCRENDMTVVSKGKPIDPALWNRGYFILPSIILGARFEDEIVSCEQFGPVVPILKFTNEDEAITAANQAEFGLRASVWTGNPVHAAAIADRLEAGAVFHNNHGIFQDLHLEFPGIKQSGVGRESRVAGLDHYADIYGFAE